MDIKELLMNNAYPGRGIILGNSKTCSVAAYFIMGRSTNSRNRIFNEVGDGIETLPFDPSKCEDPSLIIYHPVREMEDKLIVTNGDQTDTILEYLLNGKSIYEALRSREYEPDAPNYTPRISGLLNNDGSYLLSILKSIDGKYCSRYYYEYESINGLGHFIHTYSNDGNPLPSFVGEPEEIEIEDDIDEFTNDIWNSLNDENKISLYVRYFNRESKEAEVRIINKY